MTDDGFSPDEARLLTGLLEAIVPASQDGRLPSAAALDLVDHVTRIVRQTPMLRPVVEYGLSGLAGLAAERHPAGIAGLGRDDWVALLDEFATTDQLVLPAFLFVIYSGYYQHPRVMEALGLEPRPPHPKGHVIEPDDLTLLEPVRMRGRMYRD